MRMLPDTERLGTIVSPETSKQIKEARQQDTQLIHMTVQHLSVGKIITAFRITLGLVSRSQS